MLAGMTRRTLIIGLVTLLAAAVMAVVFVTSATAAATVQTAPVLETQSATSDYDLGADVATSRPTSPSTADGRCGSGIRRAGAVGTGALRGLLWPADPVIYPLWKVDAATAWAYVDPRRWRPRCRWRAVASGAGR